MENKNKLGHELLKQNGMAAGSVSDEEQKRLQRVISLEDRRITRMKWVTAASWFLLILVFVLSRVLMTPGLGRMLTSVPTDKTFSGLGPYLAVAGFSLWWIAIICTGFLAVRLFRLRGLRQKQIMSALTRIEDHLKQLEEKK